MTKYNTRGFPKGPVHGGGDDMIWDFVSRKDKRKHHAKVTARRRQSVAQRMGKRV